MLEPIRISRKWNLKTQLFAEAIYDYTVEKGLFEKTIDPDTREPVYFPLFE